MAVIELEIETIRIDGGTQPRVEIDESAVAEYADRIAAGDEFPPVDVFRDGADDWLADGFHRYHGHKKSGRKTIRAIVHKGTKRDAVLFSVGANERHGIRRTNADKRKAVKTLLADTEWGQWADREIAKRCQVSHPMVAELRKALTGKSSSDERKYTTKQGTPSVMKTARISTANRARTPESAPLQTPSPAPAPAPPVQVFFDEPAKDEEGHAIGRKELADVFGRRPEIREMMSQVSGIKSVVLKAIESGDDLFRYVNASQFKADCENLYRDLKFTLPHALCPYHADDPTSRKGCKLCGGSGWISKDKYDQAPASLKKGGKR